MALQNTRTITTDGVYWSNYWAGVVACPHEYDTIQVTYVNPDTTYSSTTSCNPADEGVFVYNGFNRYNCDSTHYDTVALASYSSTIVNITACDSALANGNWYFADTSFNDTITGGSSNGCDSITTFNVTVNYAVVTTSSSTSCNPADVGTNMTGPFTMTNGCDSTHFDTVTLLIDTATVVSNLSNCDSVFYNGTWYIANTTVLDTTFSSQGCDSIYNRTNITILPASSCSNTYTCQFDTALFDSYEYTNNIPGLIAGATIHSSPRDGTSGTFFNRQHSGDYLFYMNFSTGYSGPVYERIMDVCPNSDFRYSFWIRQYDNNPGSDITINIYDGNTTSGTLLYSENVVNSGTIYNQIVSPQLTALSNNIVFQLVTNTAGSAGGNDLCFDDLLLEICQIDTIHYSDTIGDMVLCPAANTINLFDSLPNLNTTGTWSGPSALTNGHLGTFNPAVNTAGLYTYAIPGASACVDTVYTLNTIILQDSVQTVIDSFCAGTNYLLNGGTIVTAAGNYTDTVGNAVCNTIYSYQLTTYSCLNCTVDLGNDTSFCQGESVSLDAGANYDEYLWSDNSTGQTLTVNTSGTYWVQTTIFDTANNLVANGDFEQGNAGFSSDYSYSSSGAVVTCPNGNQSWGIVGCEGTYTVITNPNAGHSNFANCGDHTSGSGNMIVVNGSNTPNMSVWCQNVTVSPNTDYVFSAWAMSVMNVGLGDVATLHFLINGVQIGADFSPSLTACDWQQFNATWNSGSNTNITICIESDVISGNNDYAIDDIFFTPYCVSSDTVEVTVNPYPVVNLGADITTCNTSVTLDATTTNATYTWQDNSTNATYNVTNSGTYYVDVTVNNCTSSDTIIVTLNPTTTGQATATICQGDSAFLANEWQTVGNVYYDTLTNANTCDSILATTLIVENPQISVTDDTYICNGFDITLQATASDSVFWSTGDETANITVMPSTTTTYVATVVSNNGCTAQDSVIVTVINSINNVSISASDTLIDAGETVTIEATADNVQSYFWEPVNSSSNSIIENPQTTTTYIVTLSNDPCPNVIDSITIQVNPILVIEPLMPTAFSPNGDSNNDVFRPANYDMFSSYLLRIYNRWGELIYQDEGYGVAWDGLYKAKPQNLDVYSYYIEATPLNTTEVKIASGNLTLIR
ncbi:MAG: gliding motility-associated C-terminal domain-containing protein [Chitinophagales bacterium]